MTEPAKLERQSSTDEVWESEPYAEVRSKIGTVEGDFFPVHATLRDGKCFYLSVPITRTKAWEDRPTEVFYQVYPRVCADRSLDVIEIGKLNVTGKDRQGRKFKTLLSCHAKAVDQSLETALTWL